MLLPRSQGLVIAAALLVLAAPAQAQDECQADCGDEQPPQDDSGSGNETSSEPSSQTSAQCQLVDYSVSSPTAVVVDPDRCFIPYVLSQVPI